MNTEPSRHHPTGLHHHNPNAPADALNTLDDLRAQLPPLFRETPDHNVPAVWLAWSAARRGHTRTQLVTTFKVSAGIADQLIALAHAQQNQNDDTDPGDDPSGSTP